MKTKVIGLGVLGVGLAVGGFVLGGLGGRLAETQLASLKEDMRRHSFSLTTQANQRISDLVRYDGFAALEETRRLAAEPRVLRALGTTRDAETVAALTQALEDNKPFSGSLYIVDRNRNVVAKRLDSEEAPTFVDGTGQVDHPAVKLALTRPIGLSEHTVLPPEDVVQVTVTSITSGTGEAPIGAVVKVHDKLAAHVLEMERFGGVVMYLDDKQVYSDGPDELIAAARGAETEAIWAKAKKGQPSSPVKIGTAERQYDATIFRLPRVTTEPLPMGYPPESVYLMFSPGIAAEAPPE